MRQLITWTGVFRSALACGAIHFSQPLFKNLGVGNGCAILGSLAAACAFGFLALWYYGPKLRARSKFALQREASSTARNLFMGHGGLGLSGIASKLCAVSAAFILYRTVLSLAVYPCLPPSPAPCPQIPSSPSTHSTSVPVGITVFDAA